MIGLADVPALKALIDDLVGLLNDVRALLA